LTFTRVCQPFGTIISSLRFIATSSEFSNHFFGIGYEITSHILFVTVLSGLRFDFWAPEINTSCLSFGPPTALQLPTHIAIFADGCAF